MSMADKVRSEMVAAMKNKEKDRKDALSMLLSALKNKAIDKREDLTEAEEFEVVKKEIKQTKETLDGSIKAGNDQERTDTLAEQVKILEEYLPKQVSGEELSALIGEVLAETGATTKKEMGRVMGALTQKTGGNFDKAAAAKVEETINALPAAADITLENKEAVAAARAAFDALTEAQQALVSKEAQDKLTACEARIAELEKPEKPTDLPFTDLTQDWYMDSIRYVYEHELMYGTTDTTFAPDDALTRGMFVTMLYRMEGKPEATGNTSFTDVPANMYYAPAIAWASANGVVYGTSETAFSPEGKITREQMAAMMRRYASFKKLDTSAKADLSTFTDASAVSAWATGDMQWAVASELLYGNNHNQLQPTANATRAQAAAILQRFATKIVK